MWIFVCDETEMCVWWNEYVYLVMQGYGHDESAPTPGGVVRGHFVECSQRYCNPLQRNGNPSAAVGADLSCPHIRKYPRNGERKRIFDNMNIRVWWNGNAYLVKRICIFDNARIRARWIGPYAWRSGSWAFRGWMWIFYGVLVGCFVVECCVIGILFAAFWQSISSCRGRFIVPAYMETPKKWGTETHIW